MGSCDIKGPSDDVAQPFEVQAMFRRLHEEAQRLADALGNPAVADAFHARLSELRFDMLTAGIAVFTNECRQIEAARREVNGQYFLKKRMGTGYAKQAA